MRSSLMKRVVSPCPIFFVQENYVWRSSRYRYEDIDISPEEVKCRFLPWSFHSLQLLCAGSALQPEWTILLQSLFSPGAGIRSQRGKCGSPLEGLYLTALPEQNNSFISLGMTLLFQCMCWSKYSCLKMCKWHPGICKRGMLKVSKRKASSVQVFGHRAKQQNFHLYVSPWKDTKEHATHCLEPPS